MVTANTASDLLRLIVSPKTVVFLIVGDSADAESLKALALPSEDPVGDLVCVVVQAIPATIVDDPSLDAHLRPGASNLDSSSLGGVTGQTSNSCCFVYATPADVNVAQAHQGWVTGLAN